MCTYKAVKAVPLRSLDRHRLHIVLSSYVSENHINIVESNEQKAGSLTKVLTPAQVAKEESFLPMIPPDDSVHWLSVGDSLMDICPSGVAELEDLLLLRSAADGSPSQSNDTTSNTLGFDSKLHEKYLLKVHLPTIEAADIDGIVQLTYLEGATDDDLLRGMFHAYTAHALMKQNTANHHTRKQIVIDTHSIMNSWMSRFIDDLQESGWQIGTGFVNVECGSSHRLKIQTA